MVIRVLDHVDQASSYAEGDVIFRLIEPSIRRGEKVVVDFTGVLTVPSAFVNAALLRLLESYSFSQVRESLAFQGTTKQINDLIRSRFEFVLRGDDVNHSTGLA